MAISCIDGLTMIGHSHPHQQQANTNVYYWWWWSQINHCVLVQPQEEEGSRSSAVEVFILVYLLKYNLFILYIEPESPIHTYKIQNPLLLPHTRAAAPKRPPGQFPGWRQREGNNPQSKWFLGPRLQREFLLRFLAVFWDVESA